MAGTLNDTPGSNRLHIGVFGKTNSGKSSFINAFTHQEVSIVADVAGTTTDPVYKPMEISPLGPCVIIDTAGFDDETELGERRVEKTKLAAEKADIAVIVVSGADACGIDAGDVEAAAVAAVGALAANVAVLLLLGLGLGQTLGADGQRLTVDVQPDVLLVEARHVGLQQEVAASALRESGSPQKERSRSAISRKGL